MQLIADLPTPASADHLLEQVQAGQLATLRDWGADRQGLGKRLSASAWTLYGFTHRSPEYEKRVARVFGEPLPYVSPKLTGYSSGKFLHTLTKPSGHTVRPAPAPAGQVASELAVPAARGLNFAKAGGVYLAEWGRLYDIEAKRLAADQLTRAQAALDHWAMKESA